MLDAYGVDDHMLHALVPFVPDLYKDAAWSGQALTELVAKLTTSVDDRRREVDAATLAELHRSQFEPWMNGIAETRALDDVRLGALARILEAARAAEARGVVLFFLSD
jgi:hypothetical protein